jgi:hypothetical protein
VYVGSSKSSVHRKKKHIYYLRKGEHKNKHLQSSWNKYGESKFIFSFLEEVSNKKERIKREQIYIDAYMSCNPKYGYNKCSANCAILSEESRKKISNAVSKLNMEQAEEIRKKYNTGRYTRSQISKEYGIAVVTISRVLNYKIWRYNGNLSQEEKEKYIQEKNKIGGSNKKKSFSGSNNPKSKLSFEIAEEIRKKYNTGNYSQGRLSKEYKVGKHTIRMIIKNIYWRE